MWHDTGSALGVLPADGQFQPWIHFENPETKRRLKNLLDAYQFTDKLVSIAPSPASEAQLLYQETAESRDKRELLREQIKNEPLGFRDQKGRPSKRDRRHIIKFTRGD